MVYPYTLTYVLSFSTCSGHLMNNDCFFFLSLSNGALRRRQIDPPRPRVKSESVRVRMSVDRGSYKQQYGHQSPCLLLFSCSFLPPPLSLLSIVHVCECVCICYMSCLSLSLLSLTPRHIHILLAICLSLSHYF